MKTKIYPLIVAITLSALFLLGCKQHNVDAGSGSPYSQNVKTAIPYADSLELQEFTNDAQIVDYRLARKLALMQLHSSGRITSQEWGNFKMSERPVIVYGFDNKPLYYDFFMCDENSAERATITVNARKSASVTIQKYGNSVDNYVAQTKGVSERLYADCSGVRYRAAGTKSGNVSSAVNLNSGQVVHNLKQMSDDELMSLLENELLPQMYQDPKLLKHHISEMKKRLSDHKAKSKAMWDFVEANQEFVDTVSDYGIAMMLIPGGGTEKELWDDNKPETPGGPRPETPAWMADIQYGPEDIAYLKKFETRHQSKARRSDDWCGPWVISYILESAYNERSEAVFNETGPMDPVRFNQDLKYYSRDRCSIDLSGSSQWEAYWDIRQKATCSMRLTSVGGYHWTCIYGAKRDINKYNHATSYYFLQADNGALIRTPWNNLYRDPMNQYSYEAIHWFDTVFSANINR